jgi:hypothetical protein
MPSAPAAQYPRAGSSGCPNYPTTTTGSTSPAPIPRPPPTPLPAALAPDRDHLVAGEEPRQHTKAARSITRPAPAEQPELTIGLQRRRSGRCAGSAGCARGWSGGRTVRTSPACSAALPSPPARPRAAERAARARRSAYWPLEGARGVVPRALAPAAAHPTDATASPSRQMIPNHDPPAREGVLAGLPGRWPAIAERLWA